MDDIRMQIIMNAAQACAEAGHGNSGLVVARAAEALGLSVGRTTTLIRQTQKRLGLAKPRKRRADAGDSAITDLELQAIAGAMLHDRRAGKWMISVADTIDMLFEAGKIATRLSANHVGKLLRSRGMDGRSLAAPTPHVRMRTEHVNAVMQIDASVCVLYKTPKGELLLLEEDGVHYKNKPENLVRVMDQLLVRFVGTEYSSAAIGVRYYSGGETTENALDFLMWLMTQRRDDQGNAMPFHGVPFMLYTDQGGCFKSAPFRNFCSAMDIRQEWHAPRASRATGQVENAQNLTERSYESRLRFLDPATITIARMNATAELWMHAYNGQRKHRRHGMARYAAWSTIEAQHLRVAPAMEIMRELPVSLAKPRTVTGDMHVSFAMKGQGSREFDVRYVPGVSPRDKVLVAVNPLAAPAVRVGVTDMETGEIVWHQVEPVEKGWMGYVANAPVLGSTYQAMPATPADDLRTRIAAQAFATPDGQAATPTQVKAAQQAKTSPYVGQFDPFADIKANAASLPTFMQRPGVPHGAAAPTVEAPRMSVAAACKYMRQELGEAYEPSTYAWLTERHGSTGLTQDVVKGLVAARRQAMTATPLVGGLRAVGGGA